MKIELIVLSFGIAILPLIGEENILNKNSALKKELSASQQKQDQLNNEIKNQTKTKETLETTRDLVSGKIDAPPVRKVEEVVIARFETEKPIVFDTDKDPKKRKVLRWLTGKAMPGKKYRVEGMVRSEGTRKTKNIKFGAFVGGPNFKAWPGAKVGSGKFEWKKVSFTYQLPAGCGMSIMYGFEDGYGRIMFKDISVFEIIETSSPIKTN